MIVKEFISLSAMSGRVQRKQAGQPGAQHPAACELSTVELSTVAVLNDLLPGLQPIAETEELE